MTAIAIVNRVLPIHYFSHAPSEVVVSIDWLFDLVFIRGYRPIALLFATSSFFAMVASKYVLLQVGYLTFVVDFIAVTAVLPISSPFCFLFSSNCWIGWRVMLSVATCRRTQDTLSVHFCIRKRYFDCVCETAGVGVYCV